MPLALPDAGIELCALVDYEVMGRPRTVVRRGTYAVHPHYSTDLGHAWKVVENMQARGYWVKITGPWTPTIGEVGLGNGCHGYSVGFDKHGQVACGSSWVQAENASICVAICHAALITLDSWARAERDERLDPDVAKGSAK